MSMNWMVLLLCLVLVVVQGLERRGGLVAAVTLRTGERRPDPSDGAGMARWLVSQNDWGVLSTISIHLGGSPWGNIASFSDGEPGNSTGTPFFYLSKLDPTPNDLERDPRCSFSLSEAPIGTCGSTDVENPTCARLTLTGKVIQVTSADELDLAAQAMFSKHPEMQGWPKGHKFYFYKFIILDIFLIDYYGGAVPLTVDEYYKSSKQTLHSL
ncbi:hypothetical protein CY35_18G002100 [Sphagnum magellanicum]|nr:hypothetical protein CY35_18G002100 [Sphagnum magellanicum]